jgi:3',5'-cyclic AMP phosphodiesterase CpdA
MRIAITADLHWGHRTGDDAVRALAAFLRADPPDVLVLAGDLGVGPHFNQCLALFADLPARKALVPGNHDLWTPTDAADDSLRIFEEVLPRVSADYGFSYLDRGPLLLPEAGLAVVGSINWYDYSWTVDELRQRFPEELHRLVSKRFPRGRHNDAAFVRWPLDDAGFTGRVTAALETHLKEALASIARAIVIVHHPPFQALSLSDPGPPRPLEWLLFQAFCGNSAMEDLLKRFADRIAFAFCGHTHRARESMLGPIRGYNVGGDYRKKRLLIVDWPAGGVTAHDFGAASE